MAVESSGDSLLEQQVGSGDENISETTDGSGSSSLTEYDYDSNFDLKSSKDGKISKLELIHFGRILIIDFFFQTLMRC